MLVGVSPTQPIVVTTSFLEIAFDTYGKELLSSK